MLRLLRVAGGQWGVAVVAVVAGVAAWWFSDRHGLALLYADARSHLTISRRLLDGPNHGIVQLGTVWLPLPHVLVAPFTLVTSWWRSGFAVVPVDIACLVAESIALFRVVLLAGRSRAAAWVAVLLLVTNPGWLYLHTTALGEPVLFAALLVTVSGLAGWIRSEKPYSGGEIALFCGLPAAAGVLARYDGWAMVAAATVLVAVVAQARWHRWRYTLRCVRSFVVIPAVAACWWFWFNFVHWGDPLEFQRGRYSAQAQQDLLDRAGLLPDKGNLARSVDTYVRATSGGAGRLLLAAGLVGAVLWLVVGRWRLRALPPWLLLVVPVGFYVMSLYTGQIALRLGDAAGGSIFNLRYGLQALPGLVVMAGLGMAVLDGSATARTVPTPSRSRWRPRAVALGGCALVLAVTSAWGTDYRTVPVITEGLQQRDLGDAAWAGAEYLHAHAVGDPAGAGTILIDDSVNPMLPVIGADLNRIAAPFSGPRWDRARQDPTSVQWVFADTANGGDAVARAIERDPAFGADFETVFRDGTVTVYRNRTTPSARTTAALDAPVDRP
jgi:hypothetical protein